MVLLEVQQPCLQQAYCFISIHLVAHEDQKYCHRNRLSEYSESLRQRNSRNRKTEEQIHKTLELVKNNRFHQLQTHFTVLQKQSGHNILHAHFNGLWEQGWRTWTKTQLLCVCPSRERSRSPTKKFCKYSLKLLSVAAQRGKLSIHLQHHLNHKFYFLLK